MRGKEGCGEAVTLLDPLGTSLSLSLSLCLNSGALFAVFPRRENRQGGRGWVGGRDRERPSAFQLENFLFKGETERETEKKRQREREKEGNRQGGRRGGPGGWEGEIGRDPLRFSLETFLSMGLQ